MILTNRTNSYAVNVRDYNVVQTFGICLGFIFSPELFFSYNNNNNNKITTTTTMSIIVIIIIIIIIIIVYYNKREREKERGL